MDLGAAIAECGALLRSARRIGALTGAGVSAESGIATFRGAGGLWRGRDPTRLATPGAFAADPALVWDWYAWRRRKVLAAAPNPGHLALAELERRSPGFLLATQNVDGLHRRAGTSRLVELHGDLFVSRCRRGCGFSRRDEGPPPELGPRAGTADGSREPGGPVQVDGLPGCPGCGDVLRPGVVWFGEPLPPGVFEAAAGHAAACDVYLVVGTASAVAPASGLADLARAAGAEVIEINPEPSLDGRAKILAGPAGSVLPRLLEASASPARIQS